MSNEADWTAMDEDGYFGLIGPVMHLAVSDTIGRFRFVTGQKHRNRGNVVHGALLMALADRAMGATVRQSVAARHDVGAPGQAPTRGQATVQLDMHFIRSVQIGQTIELECRVIRHTRSLVFVDGTLFVGADVIATARGVWKLFGSG